jgi:hypothetical protein
MKAFDESHPALAEQAGLILLLTEKLIPHTRNHDEHSQTDILTSGSSRTPAFPVCDQWPWEFVARYSGATVPDSHGVP